MELLVPREEAETRIRDQIVNGQLIDRIVSRMRISSEDDYEGERRDHRKWLAYTRELLVRIFSNDSIVKEFDGSSGVLVPSRTVEEKVDRFRRSLDGNLECLESIAERLELIPVRASVAPSPAAAGAPGTSTTVFIVHRHDRHALESVARFVERLGLEAVVLHEQASQGRTVIEKFEAHAGAAGFAVVLLTPDDVGAARSQPDALQNRARQNAIFELGFFTGRLGRERVCALYAEGVELPSDLHGMMYVPLDLAGAWKLELAKEMKIAGLPVDLNLAL